MNGQWSADTEIIGNGSKGYEFYMNYISSPTSSVPIPILPANMNSYDIHIDGINDSGQAVGSVHDSTGRVFAALFGSKDGGQVVANYGTLGGVIAAALGISNSGIIVGTSETIPGNTQWNDFQGFVVLDGKLADLNDLVSKSIGLTIVTATGVNDLGQIVAIGEDEADGSYRELLLTPVAVPEPTSVVGFGLIALAAGVRAMKRRKVA